MTTATSTALRDIRQALPSLLFSSSRSPPQDTTTSLRTRSILDSSDLKTVRKFDFKFLEYQYTNVSLTVAKKSGGSF